MTQPDAPANGPANAGGAPAPVFTQDQLNHFVAEGKRGAVGTLFKEVGLEKPMTPEELKTTLEAAAEYQKLQQGQQTELQQAQSQLGEVSETAKKVPTLEARIHMQELAGEAGLKPRYWKYVEGADDEAIKKSIADIKADLGIGGDGSGDGDGTTDEQQQQASGGSTLTPNLQQGTGGGGKPPTKSLSAGADAYKAKHKKE